MTRVSVFGLGYVGAVSVACLADRGHSVIGVDVNPAKVDLIGSGRSPIVEAGLEALLRKGVDEGRIRATTDTALAIQESDVSLVCVGTPSNPNGSLDLTYVQRVSEEIGTALAAKEGYHVVVARSTMLPGSTGSTVIPALEEHSGIEIDQIVPGEKLLNSSIGAQRRDPGIIILVKMPLASEQGSDLDRPVVVTDS